MKLNIKPETQAIIKSYCRAVLAAGVTAAITLLTDLAPQYAVVIGAVAAPAVKWVDKSEKEFGLVSKKKTK